MKSPLTTLFTFLFCCWVQTVSAQQTEVHGIVKDQDGNVVPGVNVLLMGTPNGTAVNMQGKFVLNVPKDSATLLFAFIGYKKIIHTIRTDEGVRYDVVVTMVKDEKRYQRQDGKVEVLPGAKEN